MTPLLRCIALVIVLTSFFAACSERDSSISFVERQTGNPVTTVHNPVSATAEEPRFSALESPPRAFSPASEKELKPSIVIKKVTFEPEFPVTGDRLHAVIVTNIPTETAPAFLYRWKVDGQIVQESEQSLLEYELQRGNFVEVEVGLIGASDRGDFVMHSAKIGNAAPILHLASQNMETGGVYQARLEAKDLEGDAVDFSLQSGPAGMEIDPNQGVILWQIQQDASGTFGVEAKARDSEGAETLLNYQIKVSWESNQGVDNSASSVNSSK